MDAQLSDCDLSSESSETIANFRRGHNPPPELPFRRIGIAVAKDGWHVFRM